MRKARFTEEQITYALKQVETGKPVGEVFSENLLHGRCQVTDRIPAISRKRGAMHDRQGPWLECGQLRHLTLGGGTVRDGVQQLSRLKVDHCLSAPPHHIGVDKRFHLTAVEKQVRSEQRPVRLLEQHPRIPNPIQHPRRPSDRIRLHMRVGLGREPHIGMPCQLLNRERFGTAVQ